MIESIFYPQPDAADLVDRRQYGGSVLEEGHDSS